MKESSRTEWKQDLQIVGAGRKQKQSRERDANGDSLGVCDVNAFRASMTRDWF